MSQDLSTWQEIALVAGPIAAAVAALASWATVLQARRLSREANMPDLVVQKMVDKATQTIGAIVTNTGTGTARGVGIYLAFPPYKASGPLGHGFLAPGDRVQVSTGIPLVDGVETDVMVLCRDSRGVPHNWNAKEEHRESSPGAGVRGFARTWPPCSASSTPTSNSTSYRRSR